ncbi:hypothetical protein PSN45_005325 [Yamadazyma tenuis]|uniref:Major facilitator superfamily (MFS) profile domain-containing protein n=1 Tax=Candida tenuis (strain ATCC 10573 / BCRC 21748 / CBS 615 / JCM 9827 / NBRC 10315 / NRRL Y-1498 / VKM Y-70) TaxID=590646 RepID=G3B1H2_CANTC|nr:uncharacterized protein CANTEDRAFT_121231 [Yamadazyma tenuis ATCC 10573]EGV64972.1 hypothetical protein CANTEDRAFT_121231 [Yamadazyma tenuis ATCC 10573]WEJ97766.1 hypothetical protein PSN45_005325 [Yamadazyma tenuis]
MEKDKKIQIRVMEVKRTELAERLGDAHISILPRKNLIILLCSMSLTLMLSFADQTGVTIGLSTIGKDLHCETTINWAGTASLLSNCVCQILFGRLSDIFGRKHVMIVCLFILSIADLCCGFAQTGIQFFIFRAFAGIGNGAVSSLSMVILSDVVTLEQRGKYQGILGASVGVGNAIGPFIMAGFIKSYSWRGFYYFVSPTMIANIAVVHFLVKNTKKENLDNILSTKDKLKQIDYLGIITAAIGLTLILVPISGGGSTFAWNSPLVIVMFIVGTLSLVGFVVIEWKIPELPMIPLHLFKVPSLCLLLASSFLFGMAYYGFLYYMPYFFNIVKQKSEVQSAVFLVPLVLCQAVGSIISGQIISRTGHYILTVIVGYSLWCLSNGLLILWSRTLPEYAEVLILIVMGTGVGFTFQPTMVAAQAQAKKSDRAVVISTRNVLRSFGGAVGIAVGSTIVSNSLLSEIATERGLSNLPDDYLEYLESNIYAKIEIKGLSAGQVNHVIGMYEKALRNYFYLLIPLIGVCLVSSFFIKDRGLQCIDEADQRKIVESSSSSVSNSS